MPGEPGDEASRETARVGAGGAGAGAGHGGDYNDAMPDTTRPEGASDAAKTTARLRTDRHDRLYRENLFVYPVLSRRARGISVGINLNPDKVCNFDCVYCQVDRTTPPAVRDVDETRLLDELREVLRQAQDGSLFARPEFAAVPEAQRCLRDITFAGDGEPPSYPNFPGIVRDVIALKRDEGFSALPIIVLTNATLIDRPRVKEAMRLIDADGGTFWLKLDAGTEPYYRMIERTTIPFRKVLDNILEAARVRPVVLQSLFMKVRGDGPSPAEIDAFVDRVAEIMAGGGRVSLVQVYTVARAPAESWVMPLADAEVDAIATKVRERLPGLPVESYYSGWAA
ncbi:MAG TPA: radical SAM protein [Candidatus Polarisedimenticolia bacterium]|nr:radical SAM protein [Candidatus Polarisedimenticolia bacterium]